MLNKGKSMKSANEWSDIVFEQAIIPYLSDLGSIEAQKALEEIVSQIQIDARGPSSSIVH